MAERGSSCEMRVDLKAIGDRPASWFLDLYRRIATEQAWLFLFDGTTDYVVFRKEVGDDYDLRKLEREIRRWEPYEDLGIVRTCQR